MSRLALTPTNVPVSASDISTPTIQGGDLYYNTTYGLMVSNGLSWVQVVNAPTQSSIDAGQFDSIAPYNNGQYDDTATQFFNGGTP
jgi:hypothetical protein